MIRNTFTERFGVEHPIPGSRLEQSKIQRITAVRRAALGAAGEKVRWIIESKPDQFVT